jgi:YD repeat-containing protein
MSFAAGFLIFCIVALCIPALQRLVGAFVLATALLFWFAIAQAGEQMRLYDAQGRSIGTVTTDSNGTRTFRDAGGRTTGTATTDSNGTTTFRDAGGRTTGRASGPAAPGAIFGGRGK